MAVPVLSATGWGEGLTLSATGWSSGAPPSPPPSGIKKIYIGSTQVQSLYVGSTQVQSVYVGSTKIFG